MFWIVQLCLLIAVDSLLNETDLEVVVYSGQLDLIVDTLGRSTHLSHPAVTWLFFMMLERPANVQQRSLCINIDYNVLG